MKKEIIKPFNLEAYKEGAKVKTRDGHKVRIVCTDAKDDYPIIGLVTNSAGDEHIVLYTLEGKLYIAKSVICAEDLVIVEEIKGPEYWSEDTSNTISGFEISPSARITEIDGAPNREAFYNVFAAKSQAKSALAMARISQILANDIEHFGGVVTDEEWEDGDLKYVIYRRNNNIPSIAATKFEYCFLAFHTEAQRDLFLEKYRDLVKDYLMID